MCCIVQLTLVMTGTVFWGNLAFFVSTQSFLDLCTMVCLAFLRYKCNF